MKLDIRLPTGLLFCALGLLLGSYGLLSEPSVYQRSLGYNVNIVWGIVLFLFGLLNLYLSRTGSSSAHLAQESAEGRAIETMEKRTGKEE